MNKSLLTKILFFMLLLKHDFSISQSISNLDNAHGFKDLIIGKPKSDFKGELITIQPPFYGYSGNCCRTFLGLNVRNKYLAFDTEGDSTLYNVSLMMQLISVDDLKSVIKLIEKNFGKANVSQHKYYGKGETIGIWEGNEICLVLKSHDSENVSVTKGYIELWVYYYSKKKFDSIKKEYYDGLKPKHDY